METQTTALGPLVAHAVKVYAKRRRITIKKVLEDVGMSKPSFYERANGKTEMTLTDLDAFATALGIDTLELIRTARELEADLVVSNGTWKTILAEAA